MTTPTAGLPLGEALTELGELGESPWADRLYRDVVKSMHRGFALCKLGSNGSSETLRLVTCNETAVKLTGVPLDEVAGCSLLESFPELEGRGVIEALANVVVSGEALLIDSFPTPGKRLRAGSFKLRAFPLPDRHVGVIFEDLARREGAEDAYRALVENSVQSIIVLQEGRIVFANPAAEELSGIAREELLGQNMQRIFALIHPDDRQRVVELYLERMAGKSKPGSQHYRLLRSDGVVRHLEAIANGITYNGEPAIQVAYFDRTQQVKDSQEKERLQQRVRQAEKTEAIATLAGGIAHEFNNALTVVKGNLELIAEELDDADLHNYHVVPIQEAATRMASLTSQLLAYAGGGRYRPRVFNALEFVKDTMVLLGHTVPPTVTIELDLPGMGGMSGKLDGDPIQLQMVFAGLLQNAIEAMKDGGIIQVSLSEGAFAENAVDEPLQGFWITVRDNGEGMSQETQERVFEPFFSTRLIGRGLGMAAAHGVIATHGGHIEVESELGRGTEVRVWLPSALRQRRDSTPSAPPPAGDGSPVLVVEDDERVAWILQYYLEQLGFTVIVAPTGAEALEVLEEHGDEIELALLDVVLPDINGTLLYPELNKARPGLGVIVCSGYAEEGPVATILDAGANAFVQKPVEKSKLARAIRHSLSSVRKT